MQRPITNNSIIANDGEKSASDLENRCYSFVTYQFYYCARFCTLQCIRHGSSTHTHTQREYNASKINVCQSDMLVASMQQIKRIWCAGHGTHGQHTKEMTIKSEKRSATLGDGRGRKRNYKRKKPSPRRPSRVDANASASCIHTYRILSEYVFFRRSDRK